MRIFGSTILVVMLLASAPVHAQATRTWVSGTGDDMNPCSRAAPCKTFAAAIAVTDTNGEIDCVDAGGFGRVPVVNDGYKLANLERCRRISRADRYS